MVVEKVRDTLLWAIDLIEIKRDIREWESRMTSKQKVLSQYPNARLLDTEHRTLPYIIVADGRFFKHAATHGQAWVNAAKDIKKKK